MNHRQDLIDQVKEEYARLADIGSRSDDRAEAYYEKLLSQVIHRIENGSFDQYGSGLDIVEAVANQKDKWQLPQ